MFYQYHKHYRKVIVILKCHNVKSKNKFEFSHPTHISNNLTNSHFSNEDYVLMNMNMDTNELMYVLNDGDGSNCSYKLLGSFKAWWIT